ncbi:hypothetical protein SAMN03159338_1531 [Sphingomonas sp. NFR04]|jgi:hypothetical protein|uniref:hypothetical protein n=1 Tax=Sphingomonas sp. NFR04 TaxID=1566283 RepID=UPI0008E958A5|nr:hypothetical protein [Sphingomonas sp. NFR04]SFJ48700.1 hypothetical protein SAMN03159338_1531 [Sphingomonas sp. NFR04]
MSELKAPNGTEIRGTQELVPGAAGVVFTPDEACGFEHDGSGTEMFWDAIETVEIAGATMFTDHDGIDWMQHHLIPADAEPLTPATLDAFQKEERVGMLLDCLRRAQSLGAEAGLSLLLTRHAVEDTEKTYEQLKARSLDLKARDLARVSA